MDDGAHDQKAVSHDQVVLRRKATLSIKAIAAARVHLGTSKTLNAELHRYMRHSLSYIAAQAQLGT